MAAKNVYQKNGYSSRKEYLKCMAEDYAVPFEIVATLASMLGPAEDFDGLVCALQDLEWDLEWLM